MLNNYQEDYEEEQSHHIIVYAYDIFRIELLSHINLLFALFYQKSSSSTSSFCVTTYTVMVMPAYIVC